MRQRVDEVRAHKEDLAALELPEEAGRTLQLHRRGDQRGNPCAGARPARCVHLAPAPPARRHARSNGRAGTWSSLSTVSRHAAGQGARLTSPSAREHATPQRARFAGTGTAARPPRPGRLPSPAPRQGSGTRTRSPACARRAPSRSVAVKVCRAPSRYVYGVGTRQQRVGARLPARSPAQIAGHLRASSARLAAPPLPHPLPPCRAASPPFNIMHFCPGRANSRQKKEHYLFFFDENLTMVAGGDGEGRGGLRMRERVA